MLQATRFIAMNRFFASIQWEMFSHGFTVSGSRGHAFDTDSNLYIAASWRGHRGVFKITPDLEISMVIAGTSIVGLAIDFKGDAIIATEREVPSRAAGSREVCCFGMNDRQ